MLGAGENGCKIVDKMIADKIRHAFFAAAANNMELLRPCRANIKILTSEIDNYEKLFSEKFSGANMLIIIDIFGSEKDFALNIARAAKSSGALVLGIPLDVSGVDERDIQSFKDFSDAVIMPSGNEANEITGGIIDLITSEGHVNVDFLEVESVLHNTGTAWAVSAYSDEAEKAAIKASNMCKDIRGAQDILMNITTGAEATLSEMAEIAGIIEKDICDSDSSCIWGHRVDENMTKGFYILLLIGMNDNGPRNYKDIFKQESPEKIAAMIQNGLSETQILRLGPQRLFFEAALTEGTPETVKLFISNGFDPKSLEQDGVFPEESLAAIMYRDDAIEIFNILFESGITISKNLFYCLICSHKVTPEILRAFINYGWDVNSSIKYLMFAAGQFSVEFVKVLLEAGADVNARDEDGMTPLMHIFQEPVEKLKLFLEYGADIKAIDNKGNNVFMHYAKFAYSCPEAVKIFLESGIDINAQNNEGQTVLDMMFDEVNRWHFIKGQKENREIFNREVLPLMIKSGTNTKLLNVQESKKESFQFFRRRKFSAVEEKEYQALRTGWQTMITKEYGTTHHALVKRLFIEAIIEYNAELVESLLNLFSPEYLINRPLQRFLNDIIRFSFRTNNFPEAEKNPNRKNLEIKRKLDAGAKILKLLRNSGVNVPVTAPKGKELTYIQGESTIILTSFNNGKIPDNDFEALCCAYSPEALKDVLRSGVNVNAKVYAGNSALKVIVDNYRDYYNPAEMVKILIDRGADLKPLENTWVKNFFPYEYYNFTSYGMNGIEIILQLMKQNYFKDICFNKVYGCFCSNALCIHLIKHLWEFLKRAFTPDEGPSSRIQAREQNKARLILAACLGDKNQIDEALKSERNIDTSTYLGYTPLMFACVFNSAEIVKYLISRGASLNIRNANYQDALLCLCCVILREETRKFFAY